MKISKKTQKLIDDLVEFSGSKIKNINDLSLLVEISSLTGNETKFSDIQFTAKYLNGLGKILKTNITAAANPGGNGKSVSAEEARIKIMEEFKSHMQKLAVQLADYIKGTDEETESSFTAKYFELNQQSLQNLTTLIYDLSWLKMFTNTKKEK